MKSYGLENNENNTVLTEKNELALKKFCNEERLSDLQAKQFRLYLLALLDWNEKFNLTAITKVENVLLYHFKDSLKLGDLYDLAASKGLVDIGAGAGFPGIPLKIFYPDLPVVLIEVNKKKIAFLEHVIDLLSLKHIEVYPHDWRTFLRKAIYEIDVFCARASIVPEELMRLFKPGCNYKEACLVYWATEQWQATKKEEAFLEKVMPYRIGTRKRKLVFFKRKID